MWTVTRQHQWPDGYLVVEISKGGIDYCNPDALNRKYPGEFEEYKDPTEAVDTAIKIAEAWKMDSGKRILIGHGATGGYTMPFDGMTLSQKNLAALRKWAKKKLDALPKCDHCGEPILGTPVTLSEFGDDWMFCRAFCAETWYADSFASIEENGVNV